MVPLDSQKGSVLEQEAQPGTTSIALIAHAEVGCCQHISVRRPEEKLF
jgi:hypothetical protein